MVWPDCEADNVAVPELIALTAPNAISLEMIDKELLLVFNVWPDEIVKIPLPLASLSELKLVVLLVVRLEERVIPFPEFTVKTLKIEAEFSKITDDPEDVAFKVTDVNWSESVEGIPSTVILPLVLSPTTRSPAIIFPNSVEVKLKPQVPPQLEAPKPIVALARFV
jgi:hypothetical protein